MGEDNGGGPWATLPGDDYHREETWELERERIFHGGWCCVGRVEGAASPGDVAVVDLAGESLLLVRGVDDRLRAFYNVCRHRGSQLCDTSTRVRRAIVCPYHAWSYALDGRLIGTPNVRDGEAGFRRERHGLVGIRLEEWEGFAFVDLSGGAAALPDHLAATSSEDPFAYARYGVGELRLGSVRRYEVSANWKLLVENYNECLHCPTVHPELTRLVPVYRHGEVEEAGSRGNTLAEGVSAFTLDGRSGLPALPGLDERDIRTFYGVTLFPNLIVNYHTDTVTTFLLLPRGADATTVLCHYLFRPETVADPDFDPRPVVEFRDLLARQDWAVCERTQRGVRSRAFAGGGTHPHADRYVHAWARRYLAQRDGTCA